MIRSETLNRFARALEPAGFDARAFLACYGMAECSLAVSFAPLSEAFSTDWIDGDHFARFGEARPIDSPEESNHASGYVDCGRPLPEYEVEIRDAEGNVLPDRHSGTIFVRGLSVMSGYYNSPDENTRF